MVSKTKSEKGSSTGLSKDAEALKLFFNDDYRQLIMAEWIATDDDHRPIRYTRSGSSRHGRRLRMVHQYFLQQGRDDLTISKTIDVLVDYAFTLLFASKGDK